MVAVLAQAWRGLRACLLFHGSHDKLALVANSVRHGTDVCNCVSKGM